MLSEQPQIHNFRASVVSVLRTILDCYAKPEHLRIPKFFCHWRIFILGRNLPEQHVRLFHLCCLDFYIEAVNQVTVCFPFNNRTIMSLEILDPAKISAFPYITSLASLFSGVMKQDEIQQLDTEWRLLRNTAIGCGNSNMDTFEELWINVRKNHNGDSKQMCPLLSKLIGCLLSIPHSSATVDQVFLSVNLMKTKTNNRLSSKTICGLLHTNGLVSKSQCYFFDVGEGWAK
ncbi:hypothetical protein PR048_013667 [Dryococelus australis]|uniref:HAT C-terminal dimerisation domain-containing protein n=1 Tax=Dryococelus australis TaxID=614101 RepID=A0ABQ9HT92_9NEOP|nr:hypothetical protein PR048_013667 [Dryococelus australis]